MKKFILLFWLIGLSFGSLWAQPGAELIVRAPGGEHFLLTLNGETVNEVPHQEIILSGIAPGSYQLLVQLPAQGRGETRLQQTFALEPGRQIVYALDRRGGRRYNLQLESNTPWQAAATTPPARVNNGRGPTGQQFTNEAGSRPGGTFVIDFAHHNSYLNYPGNGSSVQYFTFGPGGVASGVFQFGPPQQNPPGDPRVVPAPGGSAPPADPAMNYQGPVGCPEPMHPRDFEALYADLRSQRLETTRMSLARREIQRYCLSAQQIRDIVRLMQREQNRLELAKFAFDYVYDCDNYIYVYDAFSYERTARQLETYLNTHPAPCTGPGPGPNPNPNPNPNPAPGPPNPLPGYTGRIGCDMPTIGEQQFQAMLSTIRNASFESTAIEVAKNIISGNCIMVHQLEQIISGFSFESSKLEVAKFAWDYTFDLDNYFMLNQVFGFETSITQLMDYTSARPRGMPNPWANGGGPRPNPHPGPGPGPGPGPQGNCPQPTLEGQAFSAALESIEDADFIDTRTMVAKNIIRQNCLFTHQIRAILEEIDYESDRLEVAKLGYEHCIDPQNYHNVHDTFDYDTNVQRLIQYINSR